MSKSDAAFLEAFEESQKYVEIVAEWLRGKGYDAQVKPSEVRPSFDQRMQYQDSGDIEIRKRVEVKHRNIPFTSRYDFPYSTVFVDEVYKIDRVPSKKQLAAYIILNKDATHAAIVDPATSEMWVVEEKFDPTHGEVRPTFACPVSLVQFLKIEP